MTRLMVYFVAAATLLATATGVLRSHSPSIVGPAATTGMPAMQELQSAADIDKLPVESFEDRSLVFAGEGKR